MLRLRHSDWLKGVVAFALCRVTYSGTGGGVVGASSTLQGRRQGSSTLLILGTTTHGTRFTTLALRLYPGYVSGGPGIQP